MRHKVMYFPRTMQIPKPCAPGVRPQLPAGAANAKNPQPLEDCGFFDVGAEGFEPPTLCL